MPTIVFQRGVGLAADASVELYPHAHRENGTCGYHAQARVDDPTPAEEKLWKLLHSSPSPARAVATASPRAKEETKTGGKD